jgi:hypothetical protein
MGTIGADANYWSGQSLGALGGAMAPMMGMAQGYNPAMMQMMGRAQTGNPYLQAQIGQLGQNIGQQLGQQVLPQLRGEFNQSGWRGGSRQAIAEGMAYQGAMDTFGQQAAQMQYQDYGAQNALLQNYAQMQMAGAQGVGQMAPQIYNLGMMPYDAAWSPLTNAAEVVGAPVMESTSTSKGRSYSMSGYGGS